tara:strand:- start:204 stop:473 length:270 start_codon:yes stop_codon:yes gene_type:complete
MPNGKDKIKNIKKKVKEFFGKEVFTMGHSDFGDDTEFTISKKRTKIKGPKGKKIYKGKDKQEIDTALRLTSKKGGGMIRYKHGGIMQHD